jgi:hypothetical protein
MWIASERAMRPGDLYFFTVPPPASLAAYITQHEWLAVVLVAAALTALGLFARFANVVIREIEDKSLWGWREEREKFLDSQVVHDQGRRRRKLEGDQQRGEIKRRRSSWWDQLRLFR